MPGQNLNLVYPVIGDPIATALGKIIAMFQAIQADLQPKITPSEINWITDLSAQGHSLQHLASIGLDNATIGGLQPGFIAFDGTDFWMITPAGAVKITAGGKVNIASAGGIVGDYATVGAQVYYDAATNQYRFFSQTGARSDLVINDLWLEALTGGGSIKLKADDALAAARTFTLKDQPGANVSVLTLDSSGNIAPGVTVSNTQAFSGALTATGGVTVSTANLSVGSNVALTGTADLLHAAQWELIQTLSGFESNGGGAFTNTFGVITPANTVSQFMRIPVTGLRVGDVVQKATVRWFSVTNANTTFRVEKQNDGGTVTAVSDTITQNYHDSAWHTDTITFTTPYTVAAGDMLYVRWTPPSSTNADRFTKWSVFVTH